MVRSRVATAGLVVGALIGFSVWLAAAQHGGAIPNGDYVPRRLPEWRLTGPDAERLRAATLLRAAFRTDAATIATLPWHWPPLPSRATELISCRFLNDSPTGTTAKFNCVLEGGAVIKVKYGRNPEIHGEVAGTHLLRLLGFPADAVDIVPHVRCYGCPRDPFLTAIAGTWTATRQWLGPTGFDHGYTDFEWVAIERKFPAPAIDTAATKGWAWWELRHASAHRADLDALRLVAIFLAHWDNKSENQRLVCLDPTSPRLRRASAAINEPSRECEHPLAMIQDLGATFGPTKVNLGRWPTLPIWDDAAQCTVTMRDLPFEGGTFPDVQISEAGRRQIADGLAAITDDQLRDLFTRARFPEFQTSTDDERDLRAWTEAFRARARQIIDAGPCPQ